MARSPCASPCLKTRTSYGPRSQHR
jgi:hypothetical protein